MREIWVRSLGRKICWRRDRLPTPVFLGFPGGSAGKESACNAGDLGSIPGQGRSPGEGTGYPLQYSWASLVAQLAKNLHALLETWVRSLGREDPLEKGQATHSSILGLPLWLSWQRICLQCSSPGFDPCVGKIPWRRERLPSPVFWPGEFHGLYRPWSCRKSDTTEQLSLSPHG